MNHSKMKTLSYAMPHKQVMQLHKDLQAAGYDSVYDKDAGTILAKNGDIEAVRCMRHGARGSTWIVRADPRAVTAETTK